MPKCLTYGAAVGNHGDLELGMFTLLGVPLVPTSIHLTGTYRPNKEVVVVVQCSSRKPECLSSRKHGRLTAVHAHGDVVCVRSPFLSSAHSPPRFPTPVQQPSPIRASWRYAINTYTA